MDSSERADQITDQVLNTVKNTIGYNESPNKEEYEKGAKMAISKIKLPIIKLYEDLLLTQKRSDERISGINKTIQDFKNLFEGV